MVAVAHKHSVLSDGSLSCNFTHQRVDGGRGSQALSHIRRPLLEIPRPSSLSHDPTAAAHVKSLTGGRMMAVSCKHPVRPDGRHSKSHARGHSVLSDGCRSKFHARGHSIMIRRLPLM